MEAAVPRARRPAETALYTLLDSLYETVKGAWEDLFPYAASVREIDGKEVRIISIQAAKRIPQIPNVPTTGEQGFPEMDRSESAVIVSVLKGTSNAVIRRIDDALKETTQDPTVVKRLDDADLQPGFVGTAETSTRVRADVARTLRTIREAKPDVAKVGGPRNPVRTRREPAGRR